MIGRAAAVVDALAAADMVAVGATETAARPAAGAVDFGICKQAPRELMLRLQTENRGRQRAVAPNRGCYRCTRTATRWRTAHARECMQRPLLAWHLHLALRGAGGGEDSAIAQLLNSLRLQSSSSPGCRCVASELIRGASIRQHTARHNHRNQCPTDTARLRILILHHRIYATHPSETCGTHWCICSHLPLVRWQ